MARAHLFLNKFKKRVNFLRHLPIIEEYMGIQLSGLASGLDWQSLVSQLIAVQKIPVNNLQAQKSVAATKVSAYGTLKDNLAALKSSLTAIATTGVGAARSATLASTSAGWSASAAKSTAVGSYTFNVTQLATQTKRVGASGVSGGLSSSDDVSGVTLATAGIANAVTAGSFTVNGAKVDVAVTDSLEEVFNKISTATNGAVTASYSAATDKVTLNSGDPIVLGSGSDTSNFLNSFRLFNNGSGSVSSQRSLGALNLDASIKEANLKGAIINVNEVGKGVFSLNGVTVPFNINEDSIRSVLQRITDSAAGVSATYDAVNDRFVFTNKATGNSGLGASEDGSGLLAAFGLATGSTLVAGNDAIFSVNGSGTLVSSSNTLNSSVHGITGLSVEVTTATSETIKVSEDTGSAKGAIEDFIAKYNAVQTYINNQTKSSTASDGKVTTATLTGDLDLDDLSRSLRSLVFATSATGNDSIKRLADLGIDFSGTSNLLTVKDSAKLDSFLKSNPEEINKLFNSSSDSLVNRLGGFIDRATSSTGMIGTKTESLNRTSKDIDSQIARLNIQIAAEEARLKASFIAMEDMQSKIQNQLSQLMAAFGSK